MADQRFPLEVTLHSYRCGHKVILNRVQDATLSEVPDVETSRRVVTALADFVIEYVDALSTIFASAYVERTRFLAEVATDQRAELLHILLDGYDESDGRVAGQKLSSKLIRTLRAYAEADMNVLKAAELLFVHPNTIYSRFERIQEITGLQPRSFASLSELLLVADIGQ